MKLSLTMLSAIMLYSPLAFASSPSAKANKDVDVIVVISPDAKKPTVAEMTAKWKHPGPDTLFTSVLSESGPASSHKVSHQFLDCFKVNTSTQALIPCTAPRVFQREGADIMMSDIKAGTGYLHGAKSIDILANIRLLYDENKVRKNQNVERPIILDISISQSFISNVGSVTQLPLQLHGINNFSFGTSYLYVGVLKPG